MDVKSGQAADINPIFKSKTQSTSFGFLKHKRVSILGSTGSVGCNTVDLIKQNPEHPCEE